MPLGLIPQPYRGIVEENYSHCIGNRATLDNADLKKYFDDCFIKTTQYFKDYPCWVCINCASKGTLSFGFGGKPKKCPQCHERKTYAVAVFQSWASRMGEVFEWAFYHLVETYCTLPVYLAPKGTGTHDLEITRAVAIETKGSPSYIVNPDGSKTNLDRPGLMRTDTEKKAFANGAKYRQRNSHGFFCIVTNAMPMRLVRYSDNNINAIYDITKVDQLDLFVQDIRGVIGP